ncbi:DUF2267 domain-containing protein [Cronbergia sp. UHCC 0137]|uniref:DUF2267 domain-containing protein n=1 Tax=Cronbergia sp. UHCC 0137 TaxID=3110239 RepID=UPI002B2157F2|nr:DUF2267 domain-containing protein [Cronbergia sp. UHCC 0137]MEA5620601.1 DUF2267 domain-containing protein [Cronbergia sp. UHCC 0137]
MEYNEFITHVQTLTQSDSREEAERATLAILKTINELVPDEEMQEIAVQLPQKLGEILREKETKSNQSFNLQEFIERASQKENIKPTTTAIHARAVFSVLQSSITPDVFTKFHKYFSHDYEELFFTSP